jgi:hypothetical protein
MLHDMEIDMTGDAANGIDRFDYKITKLVGKREKVR